MLKSFVIASVATALLAPQDPPTRNAVPEVEVEEIEVIGRRRLNDRVDDFVDQISAPVDNRGPARWHRALCVGAINFQPTAAQVIVDRVSQVALELGITPGDPGCKPAVLIVATNNGAETAAGLVDLNLRLFIGGGSGMDQGRAALDRFQAGDRPIRWWHVSLPVDADTGQRAVRLPADDGPPQINKFVASRLRSPLRDQLNNVVIIVDTARIGEASFAQIADYVALIALAQIDPEADVSRHDSILNLFADPSAVDGLTDWDMAYLQGLYDANLDTESQSSRLGAVERAMAERERQRQGGDD